MRDVLTDCKKQGKKGVTLITPDFILKRVFLKKNVSKSLPACLSINLFCARNLWLFIYFLI